MEPDMLGFPHILTGTCREAHLFVVLGRNSRIIRDGKGKPSQQTGVVRPVVRGHTYRCGVITVAVRETLLKSLFFERMDGAVVEELAQHFEERRYPAQETIVKEGEEARNVYILEQGSVGIVIRIGEEREAMVGTVKERGELFGWSALVDPRAYSATARCLQDTTLLAVKGSDLEEVFNRDTAFGLAFMRKLATLIDERLTRTRVQLIRCMT
jgi:signal-transduction protein with cAMP-binding, CBS, and nucleotidyltransferase domain